MEAILLGILLVLSIIILALLLRIKESSNRDDRLTQAIREEFRQAREETAKASSQLRQELSTRQEVSTETLARVIGEMGQRQSENLELVTKRIKELTESNEVRIDRVRTVIDAQLKTLQESNEKKLDQMRQTVDEKLQNTLQQRLGESFKLVSERLEAVQRGLGEMQTLAIGVGDLKRVLTNVKARGTWGEVQLGAILEQMLTAEQYARNVQTREGSGEAVEYAIRLPGADDSGDMPIWLPIDAKFPQEDYLKLLDAAEISDPEAVQKVTANLLRAVQNSAQDISQKYLNPPHTTDFAIMFLPTEGLYAEVLRQPGQVEQIQQKYRIVIAGPTTLTAILSSLRMGFQTAALQKRSHEVWTVLSAVKTEFGKFGDVLDRVKKQLNTASSTIDQTQIRTRAMARKLREVQELPANQTMEILGLDRADSADINDEVEG